MKRTDTRAVQTDRSLWEGRYGRELDAEELRQLKENLFGFVALLQEWAAKDGASIQPEAEAPEGES